MQREHRGRRQEPELHLGTNLQAGDERHREAGGLHQQVMRKEIISSSQSGDFVRVDWESRDSNCFHTRADNSVYNLSSVEPVRGRGRSGLELLENKTCQLVSPGTLLVWALLLSLLYTGL